MTDGHRTSTIPRPEGARDASRAERRPDEHVDDTRLVRRKRPRNLLALGAFAITVAVAAALFVLPFKAWLQQRSDLAAAKSEHTDLKAANDRIEAENEQLQTVDGLATAARDDLGYQQAGEQAVAALPPPAVAEQLPVGWPFDDVSQILTARAIDQLNQAQAQVATTLAAAVPAAPTTAVATPESSITPP